MDLMQDVAGKQMEIEINGGFNPGRFKSISEKSAINLFEFENAMLPTAGFSRILDSLGGSGEGRGIFYSDSVGKCIVVITNLVFAITDIHFNLLGTLQTLTGRVYFAENGLTNVPDSSIGLLGGEVAISDGTNIYIYSLDGTFSIAKDDSGDSLPFKPGTLAYQNAFFFSNDLSSDRVYASQINNASIWPVLNFTTISEQTVSLLAFKNKLYVFGTDKTSVFYDNEREFFPYSQDVNKAWEYGNFSQSSLASSLGVMAWLGNSRDSNPTIVASNGGTPIQISTPGIDSEIDLLDNQQDCDAFMYQEDGHNFYQINFNSDKFSLLYDFTNKKWSKLTDSNGEDSHPLLATAYYKAENQLLGILKNTGKIVQVSLKIFTHDGDIVPRTIITKNYTQNERNFSINEVDLQIEQGENETTSKICFSISKDRGRTYPINKVIELGPIGQRLNLLRFRRLGAARWWTFKWDFFSQDRFVVLSAQGWFDQ